MSLTNKISSISHVRNIIFFFFRSKFWFVNTEHGITIGLNSIKKKNYI